MTTYWYGRYEDGPDPLSLPYSVSDAVDAMGGGARLGGTSPTAALLDLSEWGPSGLQTRRSLADLLRRVHDRQREIRGRGRLDGILEQARALVDTAIGQERAALLPDSSNQVEAPETDLDALPPHTAQVISQLADYDWRSPAARQTFDQLRELLRSEVLDSKIRGMRQRLQNPDPRTMQWIRLMLSDLNAMLAIEAPDERIKADFDQFMKRYGDLFSGYPKNLEELVDSLSGRMAASECLLRSVSAKQSEELAGLMASALDDAGLAAEMARLADGLRTRRPALDPADMIGDDQMSGDEPLGLSDATSALEELAELAELETALGRASLRYIDQDALRHLSPQHAVYDIETLGRIARRSGRHTRNGGSSELTPSAVRRLGDSALRQIFADMKSRRSGQHDQHDAGQAGELTGSTRPWQFGDEQPLDVPITVRNALLRTRRVPIKLTAQDFEIVETERRTAAVVSLLLDVSYSMALRGAWEAAQQTTLALLSLLRSRFPQDAMQVVAFSNYAREIGEIDVAELNWDMVQGTNFHHALMLAGRHIDKYPQSEPVVLIVTDGEPTAHLQADGRVWFDWPVSTETLELTFAEVDKMTRRHAKLSIFMLADGGQSAEFVNNVAKRNGGRVLQVDPEHLGEYVIMDFLRTRAGGR